MTLSQNSGTILRERIFSLNYFNRFATADQFEVVEVEVCGFWTLVLCATISDMRSLVVLGKNIQKRDNKPAVPSYLGGRLLENQKRNVSYEC